MKPTREQIIQAIKLAGNGPMSLAVCERVYEERVFLDIEEAIQELYEPYMAVVEAAAEYMNKNVSHPNYLQKHSDLRYAIQALPEDKPLLSEELDKFSDKYEGETWLDTKDYIRRLAKQAKRMEAALKKAGIDCE